MASSSPSSAARVCAAVVAAALGAPALAEVPPRARELAVEARAAFDTGDYQTAIERYRAVYRLVPAPAVLFNLGQCHRKLGQLDEASSYFRRYLATGPPRAQAEATAGLLEELDARRDDARRRGVEPRAPVEPSAPPPRLTPTQPRARVLTGSREAARRVERQLLTPPPPESPRPVTGEWWFWTAIATGVVVVGATAGAIAVSVPRPAATSFPDIDAR